ncbi:hypothetical protein [Streptomyces pseudogriseolus]|uniref:hypothetical protein n=1 Tax=Streptomyces pseudogriseolus TaxID=36817 RepID=UPI003FA25772
MVKIDALPNVPRWAVLAAHTVPLVTLPSALWRIAQVAGLPVADQVGRNGREAVVAISLTATTEGLALLTLGLVRPWGEVAPRWPPLIGGRRVHTLAVVVPAMLGAAALCATAGWFACTQAAGLIEDVTQTPALPADGVGAPPRGHDARVLPAQGERVVKPLGGTHPPHHPPSREACAVSHQVRMPESHVHQTCPVFGISGRSSSHST